MLFLAVWREGLYVTDVPVCRGQPFSINIGNRRAIPYYNREIRSCFG